MKSVKLDKKRKGVFIPDEFYKLDLNSTEREILAIYRYYTVEGDLKCCVYTNQRIADFIKVSVKTVKKVKKRLRELGYIRTDGGIRTYYTCSAEGKIFPEGGEESSPLGGEESSPGVGNNIPRGEGRNFPGGGEESSPLGGEESSPHNKEEKRIKKENNKEIIKNKKRVNKEEMKSELKEKQTVFDRVIPFMDQETKEQIDHIRERYKEQIDRINQIEELVEEDDITESYLMDQAKMFKDMLYKDDKIIYKKKVVPNKEKTDVSYIDLF